MYQFHEKQKENVSSWSCFMSAKKVVFVIGAHNGYMFIFFAVYIKHDLAALKENFHVHLWLGRILFFDDYVSFIFLCFLRDAGYACLLRTFTFPTHFLWIPETATRSIPEKSNQKKEQGIGSTSAGIPPNIAFKDNQPSTYVWKQLKLRMGRGWKTYWHYLVLLL